MRHNDETRVFLDIGASPRRVRFGSQAGRRRGRRTTTASDDLRLGGGGVLRRVRRLAHAREPRSPFILAAMKHDKAAPADATQNPVASLFSMPFQTTGFGYGDDDIHNALLIQPHAQRPHRLRLGEERLSRLLLGGGGVLGEF